jgi:homoserine dehydrogenase
MSANDRREAVQAKEAAGAARAVRAGESRRAIQVGLLGAGVVGEGILRLLRDNASSIETRLGAPIEVVKVVARNREKVGREVDPSLLSFDPAAVLDDPAIDVVVDPAREFLRRAIEQKKQVVTANKALLAEHGNELAELAERQGVDLYFEAAVAGGIPIIRLLREALASDRILSLVGILNGTSNYILTRMSQDRLDFGKALREAQDKGYAEADPTLDVSGGDAAHKLTLLATLAYGARLKPSDVATEGIDRVAAIDIAFAERFGYVIRPLAIAKPTATGSLELRVHPALVPQASVLAPIAGALNAVMVEGAMVGPYMMTGLGAGAAPTAMSVVSDIVDVSRNLLANARGRVPSRAFLTANLHDTPVQPLGEHRSRYYFRFAVRSSSSILARIAGVLGAFEVSIEQMVQDARARADEPVSIVMLTHEALEANVRRAMDEIALLHDVLEPSHVLRIEEV